jgi:hypothetical protein
MDPSLSEEAFQSVRFNLRATYADIKLGGISMLWSADPSGA